ncbi:MAG: S8 family serine peptidase [Vampirovibrionales bacterium]|jgi:hypothetical protein|nr:S8 family serine peptidase [Vampirovibrionales bacterium]
MSSIQKTPNTPTSSKPTVMVLEGVNGDIHKDPHSHDVARSAQRVLPEDNPVGISFRQVKEPEITHPVNNIQNLIEAYFLYHFDRFTDNLKNISKLGKNQKPNAINLSYGTTEFFVFQGLLTQQKECFNIATQEEKKNLFVFNKDESKGLDWKLPELESYMDTTIDNSTKIAKAKEKAEDAVDVLKKKNIAVVVAVPNNKDLEKFKKEHPDVQFESDEGQNILALKNTINVGISNSDGTLHRNSFRARDVDFTTQVPPSVEGRPIIMKGENGTYESGKKQSASFTTPVVAGMVAILINQGMTVDEATAYLKKLGTMEKDEYGNSYTDLNLANVQKDLARFNKPASQEK